jgi:putative two-component system response regulator
MSQGTDGSRAALHDDPKRGATAEAKATATSGARKGQILAVDDTPASLKLLTELLKAEGYDVRSAINGELALHAAMLQPPELVLLDVRMPGMSGFEVCERLKTEARTRDVPVIFISALADTEEKVRGFTVGAVDYVTKPYRREELLARVHTHLELNRLQRHLEEMVAERTQSLQESERRLRTNLLDSISAIAATVEMRDPYTAGHQRRVAELAREVARVLGLPESQIDGLVLASVVHDVGKVKVPAEILSKPGTLSGAEYTIIREHPAAGYEILRSIDFPWPIAEIVRQHHERIDSTGYPRGLKGEEILLEAQILAVADVVEAMTSNRPYRPGLGLDAALHEITHHRGSSFSPVAVDACLRVFRDRAFRFEE